MSNTPRCDGCKYWVADGDYGFDPGMACGDCNRYPETVMKDCADWCGEFKEKE